MYSICIIMSTQRRLKWTFWEPHFLSLSDLHLSFRSMPLRIHDDNLANKGGYQVNNMSRNHRFWYSFATGQSTGHFFILNYLKCLPGTLKPIGWGQWKALRDMEATTNRWSSSAIPLHNKLLWLLDSPVDGQVLLLDHLWRELLKSCEE